MTEPRSTRLEDMLALADAAGEPDLQARDDLAAYDAPAGRASSATPASRTQRWPTTEP